MINVVIVDDHALVRLGMKRLLEDVRDINVIGEAESGEAAINLVKETKPDVVLMDLKMPVMNGFEATAAIRAADSKVLNRNIPIIAMTANAMKGDSDLCLAAGMDDYISKPVNKNILAETVTKWSMSATSSA
jgi:CheY-like chemotaxis protein